MVFKIFMNIQEYLWAYFLIYKGVIKDLAGLAGILRYTMGVCDLLGTPETNLEVLLSLIFPSSKF